MAVTAHPLKCSTPIAARRRVFRSAKKSDMFVAEIGEVVNGQLNTEVVVVDDLGHIVGVDRTIHKHYRQLRLYACAYDRSIPRTTGGKTGLLKSGIMTPTV